MADEAKQVETVTTEQTQVQESPKVETKSDKTFTQDDVNKIVAERLERERSALAKALGAEQYDKEQIATAFKSAQEELEAERKAKAELQQQLTVKEQEALGLRFGVKPDKIQEALTLANLRVTDEVSLEEAIQSVANEYTNLTSVKVKGGAEVGDSTTVKNPYLTDAIIKRYPHLAKNKK
jgi:sugar diacid utilization regulator